MNYTYYNEAGDLVATTTNWYCEKLGAANGSFEGLADLNNQYYRLGVLKDKRDMNITVSGRTLTGLPRCTALVNGESFEISDGTLSVEAPPNLKVEVTLRATEYKTWETTL